MLFGSGSRGFTSVGIGPPKAIAAMRAEARRSSSRLDAAHLHVRRALRGRLAQHHADRERDRVVDEPEREQAVDRSPGVACVPTSHVHAVRPFARSFA